jgi:hypothetical protein
VLDHDQTADLLRSHSFRGLEDRPFRLDDDNTFRHDVPDEDQGRKPG